jgi:hypothetical protein
VITLEFQTREKIDRYGERDGEEVRGRVFVCVWERERKRECVCERERERKRDREKGGKERTTKHQRTNILNVFSVLYNLYSYFLD